MQTALMNVRFQGKNGHDADLSVCPLMTQSGQSGRPQLAFTAPARARESVQSYRPRSRERPSTDVVMISSLGSDGPLATLAKL